MRSPCRLFALLLVVCVAGVVFAAPGESSLSAPGSGWLQTDTDHFTIIFRPEDEEAAREVVGFADQVYEEVSAYLDVTPGRSIPVVIRGRTGDANGYFTVLPVRMVICTATASTPILAPDLDQWLRLVFTHELTHYLQLTDPVGFARLAGVLGRSVSLVNLAVVPHWLAEGLAVHAETTFTVAGRGESPVFEMQYAAAVLARDFWSFDQAFYGSDFAPRSRVYVGGYVMVDYLIRTYGIDRFIAFSRESLGHPVLGVRHALKQTLGITADEFYAAMLEELERRFADRSLVEGGRTVTPDDAGYWFLVRGRTEIYGALPTGYSRIVGEQAWQDGISRADLRSGIALNADAYSIATDDHTVAAVRAFTETFSPDQWVGYTDLVTIDRAAGQVSRVTHGRRLYHPALFPDGEAAVAVERVGAYSRLVRVELTGDGSDTVKDAASGDRVTVIWSPERTHISAPTVSPDGRSVVVSASQDGEQDLYIVDLASGAGRRLTLTPRVSEYFPVFVSSDTLWFSANPDGLLELFSLDLSSMTVRHLLSDPVGVFYATPLDDGAVYASYTLTGPAVKVTDTLDSRAIEWALADAGTASAAEGGAAAVSLPSSGELAVRRYVDWIRPELWLPLILPGRSATGIGLEAGALVAGGSLLERSAGVASGWINVHSLAPTIALQILHYSGPWSAQIDLSTAPVYSEPTGLLARQQSVATIGVEQEIARWGITGAHVVGAGLSGTVASLGPEGTRVGELVAGPLEMQVAGSASAGYAMTRERRLADLLGPAGVSAVVAGNVRAPIDPPGFALGSAVLGASGGVGVRLPAGGAMADFRVRAATPGGGSDIDSVRGNELPLTGAAVPTDPAVVFSMGLDSPAWLLDVAFRGFSLTRLGASAYVQQSIDWSGPGIEIRPETTFGFELVVQAGYRAVSLLPAVGVAVTLVHSDPEQSRVSLTYREASGRIGVVIGAAKNESP